MCFYLYQKNNTNNAQHLPTLLKTDPQLLIKPGVSGVPGDIIMEPVVAHLSSVPSRYLLETCITMAALCGGLLSGGVG